MTTQTLSSTSSGGFTAPVGEYAFLLRDAFGTDLLSRSTGGALSTEDVFDAIEAAGDFATEVLAPLDRLGDKVGARFDDGAVSLPEGFKEAYRAFAEAGWVSAGSPESAGGDGLPTTVATVLSEFWNASNAAFTLCPGLSLGAIRTLDANGSQELRDTFLPKMISGEWTGTMNLTEPQAGTDLAAVRSMARQNPDGTWAISGQKIFISWGDHDLTENIIHLVLARTENAPEGHRGISLFLVPKFLLNEDGTLGERNAVTTVGIEHKLGIHASPTCTLQYENATGYLVGELHKGLRAMFVMMNEARFGIGVQGLGISQRAFQRANDYAHSRIQGAVMGRDGIAPIAEHPDVRRLLLSMSSRISAMRALVVFAADLLDRADDEDSLTLAEFFTPLVKSWCTEESVRITSDAIQVHGGMGFIEETGAAQHFRDARIGPIYEGTTAIQSNDLVGRKLLKDMGQTATRILEMIQAQIVELSSFSHPVAQRTAERLGRALAAAQEATESLAVSALSNPRDAFAVSVPYQELLSLLTGGWMHAILATAVLKHESLTEDDQRRLTEADFFGAHHLAKVHSLVETIAAGEIA